MSMTTIQLPVRTRMLACVLDSLWHFRRLFDEAMCRRRDHAPTLTVYSIPYGLRVTACQQTISDLTCSPDRL